MELNTIQSINESISFQSMVLFIYLYITGVIVGDIGNKLGYSGMDNGFVMFENYRVPRDAMLMRYAQVSIFS